MYENADNFSPVPLALTAFDDFTNCFGRGLVVFYLDWRRTQGDEDWYWYWVLRLSITLMCQRTTSSSRSPQIPISKKQRINEVQNTDFASIQAKAHEEKKNCPPFLLPTQSSQNYYLLPCPAKAGPAKIPFAIPAAIPAAGIPPKIPAANWLNPPAASSSNVSRV